jgi:hypothetical protein
MRKLIAVSVVLLLAACSTTTTGSSALNIAKPEIEIAQTSSVPVAARDVQGGLSVRFALRLSNRADQEITLRRVTLNSVGEGAYKLPPTSKPFKVLIPPGGREVVEMWVGSQTGLSVVGANGPVTLRVVCEFESAGGRFQEVATRVVNPNPSITGEQ